MREAKKEVAQITWYLVMQYSLDGNVVCFEIHSRSYHKKLEVLLFEDLEIKVRIDHYELSYENAKIMLL